MGLAPPSTESVTDAAPVAEDAAPRVRLRFPKRRRVLERPHFQRIQSRGLRLGGGRLLVLAMRQIGPPKPSKLGITASKKCGGAVQRNRIRRVVREAFRQHPDLFPPGWDIVVIAREGAHLLSLAQVTDELTRASVRLAQGNATPQRPRPQGKGRNRSKEHHKPRPQPAPGGKP